MVRRKETSVAAARADDERSRDDDGVLADVDATKPYPLTARVLHEYERHDSAKGSHRLDCTAHSHGVP